MPPPKKKKHSLINILYHKNYMLISADSQEESQVPNTKPNPSSIVSNKSVTCARLIIKCINHVYMYNFLWQIMTFLQHDWQFPCLEATQREMPNRAAENFTFLMQKIIGFLSRVSILLLTRDIDIVILSVRLSVCP